MRLACGERGNNATARRAYPRANEQLPRRE
jgi:hypothetical protein